MSGALLNVFRFIKMMFPVVLTVLNSSVCFADADCIKKAQSAKEIRAQLNKNDQIKLNKLENLEFEQFREASIRDYCFKTSLGWIFYCEQAKCENMLESESIAGADVSDICSWAQIDCFSEELEKIIDVLENYAGIIFSLFESDINNVKPVQKVIMQQQAGTYTAPVKSQAKAALDKIIKAPDGDIDYYLDETD